MKKIKAYIARVPKPVRDQIVSVVRHFAIAFVASFAVLYPGVLAAPSLSAAKSLAVAAVLSSVAAAFRATVPFAKAAVAKLVRTYIGE